jgi:AsmA family protein
MAWKTTLRWLGIIVAGVIVIVVLALALMDWNRFKHPMERIASAKTGRTVHIGGNLEVYPWSGTPKIVVYDLTVGNPPWEKAPRPLAHIERLELHLKLLPLLAGDVVLPRVAISKADVYLHQDSSGRANWTFENKAPAKTPASGPTRVPAMRDLLIQDGKITLIDEMRRLKVDGTLQAHEQRSRADPTPLHIQGKGTINDQPFAMHISGGPLVNLDPHHPYPFDLGIRAGDITVASSGRVLKPFDLGGLDLEVTLSGKDLAEGFYLTQLALPNTPPFKLHVHIARNGMRIAVTDIQGTVGQSDMHGHLDVDATQKRPSVQGELISQQLRMKDMAAPLGGKSGGPSSLDTQQNAAQPNPNAPLFPDAHLQLNRVRAMDADVRFRATSIDAGQIPFKQVALRVKLDNGVLALNPFALEMAQGHLSGEARIDARTDVPKVHIDARLKDIQLGQLKGKAPDAAPPLSGIMEARAVIDGTGDSVHRVLADGNGMLTLVLPNGQVNAAFAELTGIDVTKGLGLLLSKSRQNAAIRCGVAQFDIRNGVMNAGNLTFDTEDVLIKGKGDINLGPEALNLEIKGEPKKVRLTRIRSPIEIRGHLRKPSFGLDVGNTVKQGAVAAALGTLVTPLAAVLAFVDPGLAKDQNCSQLIAQTEAKGPPTPNAAQAKSHTAQAPASQKQR